MTPDSAVAEPTAGEYLTRWLSHVRGRVRAKTYDGYEGLIRLYALPGIGEVCLGGLGPLDLQDLYGDLLAPGRRLSGGTVRNLHLVLAQAFAQAHRWGLVEQNPMAGVQPPRPRRPERPLIDHSMASRILGASRGTLVELPVAMAVATGMRRGEILALRWADLDPGRTVAYVRRSLQTARGDLRFEEPKTPRSRRAVALPRFLLPYLDRQRRAQATRRGACPSWVEGDLVVDRGDGGPVNPDTLSSGWYRIRRKAGLSGVRFHDLRHAHATLMLVKGIHPKVVSERLGHATVGITLDLYSHVLPSMQTEAAQAFDDLFPASAASA